MYREIKTFDLKLIQFSLYEQTCEESVPSPVSFAEPDSVVNIGATCFATFLRNARDEYYNDVARFTDLPLLVYYLFLTPIPQILCDTKFLRVL